MASTDSFLFEVEDGIGIVTLNRPDKLNPIDWEMADALCDLFRQLRERDEWT